MIMPTVPVDDELMQRFEAYISAEDDRPTVWTPEHVQARMIEAFDVLMRSGINTGPSRKTGFWPPVVHEFSDLVDQQAREAAEARGRLVRSRPTSDEASRMEEALEWPMRYLKDDAMQADALTLWCLCQATDREVEPLLHKRKLAAMQTAERMARGINSGETQAGARLARRRAAQAMVEAVNARLRGASTPAEQNAIRSKARADLAAACREGGFAPVRVMPHEAVPGICLTRKTLHKWRKRGAETVAKALIKARVVIR